MKYQQGQNREQLHIFPMSMEASISAENEVRMIERKPSAYYIPSF
jgi:hypothetical protein